jgi:hypothetical protein
MIIEKAAYPHGWFKIWEPVLYKEIPKGFEYMHKVIDGILHSCYYTNEIPQQQNNKPIQLSIFDL